MPADRQLLGGAAHVPVKVHGLTREQAYVLCSVAVDLHISQLVDVPNVAVTAILDLGVFKEN